jgi:hypothetical protein
MSEECNFNPNKKSDWQGELSVFLVVDAVFMRDRLALLPREPRVVVLVTGSMIAFYGGYATPSEMARLGAVLALDTRGLRRLEGQ